MYIEFGSKGRFGQFGSEAEDYFVEDMSGRTGLAQAKLPAEESCVIAVTTVKLFWDIVKNLVKTQGTCTMQRGKYIIFKTKKNVVMKVKVHEQHHQLAVSEHT